MFFFICVRIFYIYSYIKLSFYHFISYNNMKKPQFLNLNYESDFWITDLILYLFITILIIQFSSFNKIFIFIKNGDYFEL